MPDDFTRQKESSRRENRDLEIYDVNLNDASFETKILHAKQREWIIFILQGILNNVVIHIKRHPDHFHVLKRTSARGVKKAVN